jgi:hypothetical protein
MTITDLVTLLRLDIGDTAGEMPVDEYLARCVTRAAYALNKDAGTPFTVSADEVTPDPTGEERARLLLKAHINVCSLMRSITAKAFSFKSGDKSVDKSVDKTKRRTQLAAVLPPGFRFYAHRVERHGPSRSSGETDRFLPGQPLRTGAGCPGIRHRRIWLDPWGASEDDAEFHLSEMIPIGGLERPNYSNLRRASVRYSIEDVLVFDNEVLDGKIVLYRNFHICNFGSHRLIETYIPDE